MQFVYRADRGQEAVPVRRVQSLEDFAQDLRARGDRREDDMVTDEARVLAERPDGTPVQRPASPIPAEVSSLFQLKF